MGRTGAIEVSAGGVVFCGEAVLLLRTAAGDWVMPKGHVEPGESAEAAALREVQEEAGIRARILRRLAQTRYPLPEPGRLGGLVTVANTWMKWPVSTSQLAVFSVVGAAVAKGEPIFWSTTIAALFLTWFATPAASAGLGFGLTRLVDRVGDSARAQRLLRLGLLLASCYAAYTLGANNTGNSVGVLIGLHLLTPLQAGFVGGLAMAVGALTWGRPILEKVGKGIVQLDLSMGVGAKAAQSITAHTAAFLGYPTSMNQALIGGVAGAGATRGLATMDRKAMRDIVVSWFFTPIVGGVVSAALYTLLTQATGVR